MSSVNKHLGLVEEQNQNTCAEAQLMGVSVGQPDIKDEISEVNFLYLLRASNYYLMPEKICGG